MYTLITIYTKGFVVETGTHRSLMAEYANRIKQHDAVAVFVYDPDGDLYEQYKAT